jgi:hypothetical protein
MQVLFTDAHSAFEVHDVMHAVALAQIKPPPQAVVVPGLQVPVPLQVPAVVSMLVLLLHAAGTHEVPDGQSSHAPPPLHFPSLPQEAIEAAVH